MQLNHYNSNFKKENFPIVLACEHVSNAANLGSFFRTADAFGVEKLILSGDNLSLEGKMRRTSRATEKSVNYLLLDTLTPTIEHYKDLGWQIVALEITSTSKALSGYQFDTSRPILLIVGNENLGVSKSLLDLADCEIHIEMFGQNSSMNVVQATSIALYEITRQWSQVNSRPR